MSGQENTETRWEVPTCPPPGRFEAPAVDSRLPPEISLLLCCARTQLEPSVVPRIEALIHQGLRWDWLLKVAAVHKLLPLVSWHLHRLSLPSVPESVQVQLADSISNLAAHNLFLSTHLIEILDLLRRQYIFAIPFKGPVFTASVYGNLSLRQFLDLDVLVHESDLLRARDHLIAHGYEPIDKLRVRTKTAGPSSRFICALVDRATRSFRVELHSQLEPWFFPMATKPLFERAGNTAFFGANVPTLCPEDLVLMLCVHGTKHWWNGMDRVTCVAETIRCHPEIKWAELLARAQELGGRRMLLLGLLLAHRLVGTQLDSAVVAAISQDLRTTSLATFLENRLLRHPHELKSISIAPRVHILARERLRDKARYCVRVLLSAEFEEAEHLQIPKALSPLYWTVRSASGAANNLFAACQRGWNSMQLSVRERRPMVHSSEKIVSSERKD